MKKLVTGGAGFLGSQLCEYLLNKGEKVICIDDLSTGSKNNITHILHNPNFEFIQHDILDPILIRNIDQIYNLACPASPKAYQQDPVKTIKISTVGMVNMLELAKKVGARILQASTSEVYGDPKIHPQIENYWGNVNPIGPRSCYDEGKRVAESLMLSYNQQYNTEIRIVRIFNTYGPKMAKDDGRVISNIIVQALNNQDITIYGNGSQTRSFCYVDDMIEGIYKMMNQKITTGPINLGNPVELSITKIAEMIIQLTNTQSKIVFNPLPVDDPIKRQPDISLAKETLDWEPKINIIEGLTKTIEHFKTWYR